MSKRPVAEIEEEERAQIEEQRATANDGRKEESHRSQVLPLPITSLAILSVSASKVPLSQKLKALYKAQDTLPKLIDDERLQEQSLTKYYIKLQVLLKEAEEGTRGAAAHDKVIGEKAAIEIENIFSQVDDAHPEAGKVLLLGGAGVGKTTLLHYMSYRWGVGEGSKSESDRALESRLSSDLDSSSHSDQLIAPEGLWGNKFDYMFRVRLKELLSEEWREDYEAYFEPPHDKLSFFIHHCLMLQRQELKQKIENIKIENPHKQLTRVQKEKLEEELSKEKQKLAAKIPTIDIEEVISSLKQDKVLLLLDGYDEVAHLAKGKGDFKDIMDSVFERQHVIMSSRPNALGGDIKGRFERTIESRGLDFEGIAKYIDLHFKDKNKNDDQSQDSSKLGEELKLFLTSNTQVRGMCEVPINTALICLIWGDREVRDRFTGNQDTPNINTEFNIGKLYHEVIVWLGKRYLEKFEDRDPDNITEDNVLLSPEVKFLKTVAYDSFIKTGKLVSSKVINAHLGYLDIRKVNKFGLLKPDGEGREIVKQNHQFVHLTFHEYLSAYYLKEQLLGDKSEELEKTKKAAYFIATHRSEPKYLMTLKFLSGLVSNEQDGQNEQDEHDKSQVAQTQNKLQTIKSAQLVTRFWEAVTCNVDGVLELGIETKVTLLMHLLAQAKTHGKTDPRIPNLKTIEQLIDEVVLQDITKWGQQIIESGYVSKAIAKTLTSIMEQNEEVIPKQELSSSSSSQAKEQAKDRDEDGGKQDKERVATSKVINHNLELKVAAEIITSLINKSEFGGREVIFKFLISLVKSKDWQVQKIGLEKLKQVIDKTINHDTLQEASKVIMILVVEKNLSIYAANILINIIKIIPNIAGQSLDYLKELLADSESSDDVKDVAAISFKTLVQAMPEGEALEVLKKLLVASESSDNVKQTITESLGEVVKAMPSIAGEVFEVLKELLADPESQDEVKEAVVKSLTLVVEAMPSLAGRIFESIQWLFEDSNYNWAKEAAIKCLSEIVKAIPSRAQEVLAALKGVLADPECEDEAKEAVAQSLDEVVKAMPSIAREVFEVLKELLADPKADNNVKRIVAWNLSEIVKVVPSIAREILEVVKDVLADPKIDWQVASVAEFSLNEVIKAMPTHDALKALERLLMNPTVIRVTEAASKSLSAVIKVTPAEGVLKIFKLLAHSEAKCSYDVSNVSIECLRKAAKGMSGQEALVVLKQILVDPEINDYVKRAAAENLAEVVKEMPAKEILGVFKSLLVESKPSYHVVLVVHMILAEVAKAMPAGEVLEVLKWLLVDPESDDEAKKAVTTCLNKVVKQMSAEESFKLLKESLADQEGSNPFKEVVSKNLIAILEAMQPMEFCKVLKELFLDPKTSNNVKAAVIANLSEVEKAIPVAQEALSAIKELLTDLKALENTKILATKSLKVLVKSMPNTIAKEVFEILKGVIIDPKALDNVKLEVLQTLEEVAKTTPSLAKETLKVLKRLVTDPGASDDVKVSAAWALIEVIRVRPAEEVLETLKWLLDDQESVKWSKCAVASSLSGVVEVMPVLAAKVLEVLKRLSVDPESSDNAKKAVVESLGKVAKAAPSMAKEVFEILKTMITKLNTNDDVKKAAMWKLTEVVKEKPALAESVLEVLKGLLADRAVSDSVKKSAIWSVKTEAMPTIAWKVLGVLRELLADLEVNGDVKEAARQNLATVVKTVPASIAQEVFEVLKTMLEDASEDLKESLTWCLDGIASVMPSIAEEVCKVLKELFVDSKTSNKVQTLASMRLSDVVRAMPPEDALEVFKMMLEDPDSNYDVKNEAASILEIAVTSMSAEEALETLKRILEDPESNDNIKCAAVFEMRNIVGGTFEVFKGLIIDPKTSNNVKETATNNLSRTIETIPLNKAVDLLTDQIPEVREAAKKAILAKLGLPVKEEEIEQEKEMDEEEEVEVLEISEKIDYAQAISLLKIISTTKDSEEDIDTELNKLAKNALKVIATTIEETGIKWFNDHFNDLPNSSEAKSFLKDLYHKVLTHAEISGKLSDTESEFIIKCIAGRGLTSIIIPREGKIIFEDTPYKLSESTEKLTEIVEAVLKQSEDSLAIQYRDHEPLFVNTGSALSIAAADIKDGSLVDGQELQSNSWKLSLMHLSNHKQEAPSKVFILLERRGETGEHLIYKFSLSENKLQSEYFNLDPRMITTEVCTAIFTEMQYLNTKPRYYVSILDITQEEGENFINYVKKSHSDTIEANKSYVVLHRIVIDIIKSDGVEATISQNWNEYVLLDNVKEFEKASLLKVDSAQVRRDSINIETQDQQHIHREQINDHTVQLTEHEKKIQIHTKALVNIQGTLNILEYVTKEIHKEVEENKELSAQEKAKRHEEIKSLDQSVKGIVTKVDAQEPIIQEITSEMKDLLIRKGTDTKTFITLYKKVKVIEEQLTNQSIPKVLMLHQVDNQEESDGIELQAKVITTPVPTSSSEQQNTARVTILAKQGPITIQIQPKHSTEAVSDTNNTTFSDLSLKTAQVQDSHGPISVKPQPDHNNNQSNCCTVMMIHDMEYTNPVLNHPELLRQFNRLYGKQNLSKLIDFSSQFTSLEDRTTLEEICSSQDGFNNLIAMMGLNSLPVEF